MSEYRSEPTNDSPEIVLNSTEGTFKIAGKSFPENSASIYEPVLDWFKDHEAELPKALTFEFDLYYISTSSQIMIAQIVKALKALKEKGKEVRVLWKCEDDDEDIIQLGEKFQTAIGVDFEFETY